MTSVFIRESTKVVIKGESHGWHDTKSSHETSTNLSLNKKDSYITIFWTGLQKLDIIYDISIVLWKGLLLSIIYDIYTSKFNTIITEKPLTSEVKDYIPKHFYRSLKWLIGVYRVICVRITKILI